MNYLFTTIRPHISELPTMVQMNHLIAYLKLTKYILTMEHGNHYHMLMEHKSRNDNVTRKIKSFLNLQSHNSVKTKNVDNVEGCVQYLLKDCKSVDDVLTFQWDLDQLIDNIGKWEENKKEFMEEKKLKKNGIDEVTDLIIEEMEANNQLRFTNILKKLIKERKISSSLYQKLNLEKLESFIEIFFEK